MESSLLEAARRGSELPRLDGAALSRARTGLGNSALHVALSYGHVRFAGELVRASPALLWAENRRKETPLHVAASSWDPRVLSWLRLLLASSFNIDWSLEENRRLLRARDADGHTVLHRLVMRRLRARSAEDMDFLENQVGVAREMLRVDGELSRCVNNVGESALYLAANVGSMELVEALLEYPCPQAGNGGPCGRSPLHAAIRSGVIVNLDQISRKRPNYTTTLDDSDWTPLHCAARSNNINMARILLERGCSIESLCKDGASPVHVAAAMGFLGLLKVFVDKRPECLEVLDSKGRNALHAAAENGRREVAKYILRQPRFGALVNQRDANGNTPLQLVKRHDWILLTMFLLDKRVQLLSENHKGETIADDIDNAARGSIYLDKVFFHYLLHFAVSSSTGLPESAYKLRLTEFTKTFHRNKYDWRMKRISILATLVATVTFAAGLSSPGGYISDEGPDQGLVALGRKPAFKAFIWLDATALFLSVMAVGMSCTHAETVESYIVSFTLGANQLLTWAILLMAWAFVCGIYAILEPYSHWLVILLCLLCTVLMLLLSILISYRILKMVMCYLQLFFCMPIRTKFFCRPNADTIIDVDSVC